MLKPQLWQVIQQIVAAEVICQNLESFFKQNGLTVISETFAD